MDFATDLGDATTQEGADRARRAWELYHGGNSIQNPIEDLIADLLHLANDEEQTHPGGADGVMERAVRHYETELLVDSEAPVAEIVSGYFAQMHLPATAWFTIGHDEDRHGAAEQLRALMQSAGFRLGELNAHIEDLVTGHVLTSDEGCEFRVIEHPGH
jgi:hypothetical protein